MDILYPKIGYFASLQWSIPFFTWNYTLLLHSKSFLDLFSPLAYYLSLFSKVLILIYDLFNLMEMNSTRAKGINQK